MVDRANCSYSCIYYHSNESDGINASDIDLNKIIAGQNFIAGAYISIGAVGTLLNAFILWILTKVRLTNSRAFRLLLTNLVVADLLSAVGVILLGGKTLYIIDTTKNNSYNASYQNNMNVHSKEILRTINALCNSSYIIFFLTNFVSALTLTSLAIERYRVFIVHGTREAKHIQTSCCKITFGLFSIWIISIAASMLFLQLFELTSVVNNRCLFANHPRYCYYNNIVTMTIAILFCAIPAATMIICYCSISIYLFKHHSPKREDAAVKRFSSDKQAAILSIVITIIFIVTMTPFMAYLVSVTWTYCNADEFLIYMIVFKFDGRVRFDEAAHFLFILPPMINPLCYSFSSSRFRQAVISISKERLMSTQKSISSIKHSTSRS